MNNKLKLKNIQISSESSLTFALSQMNKNGFKSLLVTDVKKNYLGVISDGDIRKKIIKKKNFQLKIKTIYQRKTIFFYKNKYNIKDIKINFLKKKIDIIPILSPSNKIVKVYFFSDLINLSKKRKIFVKKINNTGVIIMSGGKGTRLKPHTNILPKPLISHKGKPLIEHVINQFSKYGLEDYIFSINYKSHIIKAFFKELKLQFKINYLEENKPLGTAGSLSLIQNQINRNYFISNCDTIISADLSKIFSQHIKIKNHITIVVSKINYKLPYGMCTINHKNELKSFSEKPEKTYIVNTGLYLLKSEIIKIVPKNKFFHMTDLIELAKRKNFKVGVYLIDKKDWLDLGSIESIRNQ
jgi:dTDP-glucose pyrophosphorylase